MIIILNTNPNNTLSLQLTCLLLKYIPFHGNFNLTTTNNNLSNDPLSWILSSLAFVALAGTAIDLMGYKGTRLTIIAQLSIFPLCRYEISLHNVHHINWVRALFNPIDLSSNNVILTQSFQLHCHNLYCYLTIPF